MRRPSNTPAAITAQKLGPRAPFAPFRNRVTVTGFVVTDFSHEVVC